MLENTVLVAVVQSLTKAFVERLLPARAPRTEAEKPALYPAGSEVKSNYAVETGKRIHYVRDQLLGMSKRQMCERLDLSTVSQLERYESGIEEFPLAMSRTFENTFCVNPDYMDGRSDSVFEYFHLCADKVTHYLSQGYKPVIVCNPCERSDLFCHITFERFDEAFPKIHVGDLLCSFASSGGGRLNIEILISAMLDIGLGAHDVRILRITDVAWAYLVSGRYHIHTSQRGSRFSDWECQEIWLKWFAESQKSRQRWERFELSLA